LLADPGAVGWLEIHAENYMGDGGRPLAQLRHLRDRFPLSVHGVGLSIGGEGPLDADHLARLKHLLGWLEPASFSEHLAWSTHDGAFLNDLLPLPYTATTLARVVDHIDQVQEVLGRRMLLENPSTYLAFAGNRDVRGGFPVRDRPAHGLRVAAGCEQRLRVGTNLGFAPDAYVDAFPLHLVGEIHLGGHDAQADDHGAPLLIDSHGRAVADPVWTLYDRAIRAAGPIPTLIEWDNDVPGWPVLAAEAARAARVLEAVA
jgi:uncharacterized protein